MNNFFFQWRIYGVNFPRIDNGPHSMMISTIAARGIFKKNLKIGVIFFMDIHETLDWKKNKNSEGHSLIETA